MRFKYLLLPIVALFVSMPLSAAQGRWTEGFGQGNLEYFYDSGNVRINISCPTKDGSADQSSSVSVYEVKSGKAVNNFSIKVNGNTYEDMIDASSRVGSNNFLSFLDDISKADVLLIIKGQKINFRRNDSVSVLPKYSKVFVCNLF